jgi:hypothetical protein
MRDNAGFGRDYDRRSYSTAFNEEEEITQSLVDSRQSSVISGKEYNAIIIRIADN